MATGVFSLTHKLHSRSCLFLTLLNGQFKNKATENQLKVTIIYCI